MDEEPVIERLVGNRAIETAAVLWVMELERAVGRAPLDRRFEAAFSADIESPPRLIEVKAVGGNQRGWFVPLEVPQVEEARRNPNFYLYVVDNVAQGNPAEFRLKVFGGEQLARLLVRAKERRYFEMPIPVAEFDSAPGRDAI
ncbi:MAG: DUF3883 domain-containing protein [Chloroflexota bacterium]|nr:DUF3883 domain-containing protein [Chloroflexota bacterium]